jgi:hypothetical protein
MAAPKFPLKDKAPGFPGAFLSPLSIICKINRDFYHGVGVAGALPFGLVFMSPISSPNIPVAR